MRLGIYEIHPGVIWENETSSPKSITQVSRTILGNTSLVHVPILKRTIILSSSDAGTKARGYFSRDLVEYLMECEYSNTEIVFNYRGSDIITLVSSGGLKLVPKAEVEFMKNTYPYTGTVTLMEV